MTKLLITDEEYAAEVKKHTDYLNWVFGLSTIFLSVSCLQFQTPWRAAVLCLGAVVPMYIYAFASFPRSMRVLRKLHVETKDPEVRARVKELEHKFHGWRVIFTLFILWFAIALYLSVLFSWGWLIHFAKA